MGEGNEIGVTVQVTSSSKPRARLGVQNTCRLYVPIDVSYMKLTSGHPCLLGALRAP